MLHDIGTNVSKEALQTVMELGVERQVHTIEEAKQLFELLGSDYLLMINELLEEDEFEIVDNIRTSQKTMIFEEGEVMAILHKFGDGEHSIVAKKPRKKKESIDWPTQEENAEKTETKQSETVGEVPPKIIVAVAQGPKKEEAEVSESEQLKSKKNNKTQVETTQSIVVTDLLSPCDEERDAIEIETPFTAEKRVEGDDDDAKTQATDRDITPSNIKIEFHDDEEEHEVKSRTSVRSRSSKVSKTSKPSSNKPSRRTKKSDRNVRRGDGVKKQRSLSFFEEDDSDEEEIEGLGSCCTLYSYSKVE